MTKIRILVNKDFVYLLLPIVLYMKSNWLGLLSYLKFLIIRNPE